MPVDVNENSVRVRVKDPGVFKPNTFRTIDIGAASKGIKAVVGKLKAGGTSMVVQTYIFDKAKWSKDEAVKWAAANKEKEDEVGEVAAAEVKTKMYDEGPAMVSYIPLGATSFADVDEYIVAEAMGERVQELTRQFQTLAGNILYSPDIADKEQALNSLVRELDTRLGETVKAKGVIGKMKEAILSRLVGVKEGGEDRIRKDLRYDSEVLRPTGGLMVWKEADTYRWLAIYSNKYMDQDTPPEIISEAAHKEFIAAVEAKEAPYPELWHFHVPGTRYGQADMLAYDDAGFVIAAGTIDKGHEAEAEAVMGISAIRVSHGMWRSSVRYDPKEKGVITRYRSVEISDLPLQRAANPLTGFYAMKEGENMGLPADKKAYLKTVGLSDERILALEKELEDKAGLAKEAGLASKEGEPAPEAPKAPASEPKPDEKLTPQGEQPTADAPIPLTAEAIAGAVTAVLEPFSARLGAVEAAVSKEKAKDEQRIVEKAADTPAASLAALVMRNLSVRGQEAAKLAPDFKVVTPVESKEASQVTGIPWLDKVIAEPPKK
jgi:hypothetical protein